MVWWAFAGLSSSEGFDVVMERSGSSSLEQDLAKLIVQTLKLKVDSASIQPDAPLFGEGLGLDSIDALELSLAISQTYGYQLKSSDPEIKAIFSSLRALAKAIEKNRTK
jgi:acyl carrier protein